ncbi:bark storage protein A [Cinnamomum micranthum f. kanehirae]|uniref:Bark storage protein A n=1 Tax=Cinnamomum micranthum f. kanehirae TaxID=337451 RepID=A0A3S3MZG4_9MAGN|nr:bark storage protein A [Cinnamomum micranthum f. kanehirae]
MAASKVEAAVLVGLLVLMGMTTLSEGTLSKSLFKKISRINKEGPFLGVVVPNAFEMNPLLESSSFVADERFPYLDFAGRRFRMGRIENEKIILVMTGLGMLNAGLTTQLLLSLFRVKGVVHFGIAGNANTKLQIGDVTIPHYWAHTGLWNWQRYGDGPDDELALESNGDYTRRIGYLKLSDYNNDTKGGIVSENLLNNIWYQPEEIFTVDGYPETRQHAFWVPVDKHYFSIARKLEGMKLEGCINSTTCLPRKPVVTRVRRGSSANIFVDNAAYRNFLNSKFNVTPIDMESSAVALVCLQNKTPFIAFRALSDLAGGGSSLSNEASIFSTLAAQNAVLVVVKFISLLFS